MATSEQRQRIELLKIAQLSKRVRAGKQPTICIIQSFADESTEDAIEAAVVGGADISGLLIVLGSWCPRAEFERRREAGRGASWSPDFNRQFIESARDLAP